MSSAYVLHAFDVIDVGQIDLVRQVRDLCSPVVLGVLSDDAVERHTGRRPVIPLAERLTLVGHLRGVTDAVVHVDGQVPTDATVFVQRGSAGLWPGATELDPRVRTTSTMLLAAGATSEQVA